MNLRLYDTASRAIAPFTPQGETVGLYVCGVTPYDTTHMGHAFTYVVFDTLVRVLHRAGWAGAHRRRPSGAQTRACSRQRPGAGCTRLR